ncbi:PadR family transcriptional regulator [Puerhibacterium puerhi]|uniref:PadR family transcriptional regulator n=1 Tax=Puerhibacterium puerhi TaxID=2692623 RepID=UPI001F303005|nr:PadR family transcriptional regulator [Puerhibacterium puerhi]
MRTPDFTSSFPFRPADASGRPGRRRDRGERGPRPERGAERGFDPCAEGAGAWQGFGPRWAMAGGMPDDAAPRGGVHHSGRPTPEGDEPFPVRRGGRRGPGFGPGFGPFGPGSDPRGPGFGHGFGPRGGRGRGRAARGEIRAAILLLLAERPMHGYQVISELAERTEGAWRPSPGAVYPALSLLADEGLVVLTDDGGRKLASLTEAGTRYVEEHRDELGTPWERAGEGRSHRRELRTAVGALMGAVEQVARAGTPDQAARVVSLLDAARRDVYRLLANDAPAERPGDGDAPEGRA